MKTFLSVIVTLLLSLAVAAQGRPGRDDSPVLTPQEAQLLDSILQERPGAAALAGKRVAFVTGSLGHVLKPKSEFFQNDVLPWTTKGRKPEIGWRPFTEAERRDSGGYDGLLLGWVKQLRPKQRRVLIQQLNLGLTSRTR